MEGGGAWSGANNTTTRFAANEWRRFATVQEADTMAHYLNGDESAFTEGIDPNVLTPSPSNLVVGDWAAGLGGPHFTGKTDEVLVADHVLAADESADMGTVGIVSDGADVSARGNLELTWASIKAR